MADISNYVGTGAGIFTACSLLPQLFKILKEKKAEAISFFMLFILLSGLGGWIWYGILKKDWPIIITIVFLLSLTGLLFIFLHGIKRSRPAEIVSERQNAG